MSALELALRAHDIGAGDEVITASHTFVATAFSISLTGAKPVFVDVDSESYNLNPSELESAITPRTRAILPVHLYGQPAAMDEIVAVAQKNGLALIEDACQAHGARYLSKRVGGFGQAGCFSFYPGKNLGAYGDGGMLVTNDEKVAEKVKMLRNYGQAEKYHHVLLGYNRRLDTLQAAVLRVKLPQLDRWNSQRRRAAQIYSELLADIDTVSTPTVSPESEHVYHLYVIQHPRRDALMAYLREQNVYAGLHYPAPVHRQPCYQELRVPSGKLPVTEAIAPRLLSLPMYPEIEPKQIERVCDLIRRFV